MEPARVVTEPQGLVYIPDFITPEEEQELISWFETLQFRPPYNIRSAREILHYGKGYDPVNGRVTPAEQPIPQELMWLRDRCAEAAGLDNQDIEQALIARYSAGADMKWHTDLEAFGDKIIGVSLAAPGVLQLRKLSDAEELYWAQRVDPRSMYVLGGEARHAWEHGVVPTEDLRYSVTFRTINDSDV